MTVPQEENWSQARVERLIADSVEESLTLDYKAAGSLAKTDSKRKEITKDVSAFVNSAGGTIIYGVKEYQSPDKRHLPEKIDPISRLDYSKEWLEHVVQNIRPRIEDVKIISVDIDSAPEHVVYVIEIPPGTTAHQATDLRYYRRFNFESVPMPDHEIRDVMNRSRYPKIEVSLSFEIGGYYRLVELDLFYRNVGRIYADYVNGFVEVPADVLPESSRSSNHLKTIDGQQYESFIFENLHKDLVQIRRGIPPIPDGTGGLTGGTPDLPFYVTRYDPVLPGLGRHFSVKLGIEESKIDEYGDYLIHWSLYADNAPKQEGMSQIGEIPLAHESDDN